MRVLIIGGGFGGLAAAKALARSPVEIVLIDRQNHHCFQPLLYQVATATLSPADIAWPIRSTLSGQRNLTVLMAEVNGINTGQRLVQTSGGDFGYDQLVIATGATHAYFGHEDWTPHAPGLKRIEDATEIRRRILLAFGRAELAPDPATRQALCTFVVIVGGFDEGETTIPLEWQRIQMSEIQLIPSASFAMHDIYREQGMGLDLIAKGRIDVKKLITHRFTLDEINEAFDTAQAKQETGAVFVPIAIE